MSQFSLFGAAAAEPSLDDLDGVLLAGGLWVRNGHAARLSIVVADRWRADALSAEFDVRTIGGEDDVVPAEGGYGVRTAFTNRLTPVAARWLRGANQGPPPGFALNAAGLRLWALANGRSDPAGYLLGTARSDDVIHSAAGAQLSRLGVAAVSVSARGGPGWRVTSLKRIRRLAELLGAAPEGGAPDWPQPL
jgi:hypothetical protein